MYLHPWCLCVQTSSSYKDASQTGLRPVHMTSFYLQHLFKGPLSKSSHTLRYWGLGLQHTNLEGAQVSSQHNAMILLKVRTVLWSICVVHLCVWVYWVTIKIAQKSFIYSVNHPSDHPTSPSIIRVTRNVQLLFLSTTEKFFIKVPKLLTLTSTH